MIALFCRLYKTKRMQHMSCILLFCIYIPHYSNYLSIFIRYTPTQTEGHIPCLRHQQLYFQIVQYFFLRYTWILQQVPCYSCTYSGDRIGGSFLIFIASVCAYIYCLTAKIPQRTYGIPVSSRSAPATPITSSQAAGYTWLPEGVWKLRFPAAASIRTPFSLAY